MKMMNKDKDKAIQGCELCGDFPAELRARCHPTAPLRIEMEDANTMAVYCYVPECNRLVARFKIELLSVARFKIGCF